MKKVLITGITGFAGSFLAEELCKQGGYEIHGTYLNEKSLQNIAGIQDKLSLSRIDLTNNDAVSSYIATLAPDQIYHLAALPSPAESFKDPVLYIHNNVDIQLNILEAIRKNNLQHTRILIVSSAEVYGLVSPEDLPIDENTPFRPTSPYSVSKATQDLLGLQYYLAHNLKIIRVRPFNHIGPRQSPDFVVSAFAQQVAQMEKSEKAVIRVGNLEAKRDFTDVRDMVKAYSVLMEKGIPGEVYNVGRGTSVTIKEILETLLSLSQKDCNVETDPARLRPSDIPNLVCDTQKIKELGWEAQIPLKQTLQDTLDYWRAIV